MPRSTKSVPVFSVEINRDQSRLATGPEDMAQRKVMDMRRWYVSTGMSHLIYWGADIKFITVTHNCLSPPQV